MKHTVITSFDKAYYERCGKRFVETFRENWPESVQLALFPEGFSVEGGSHSYAEVEGLWQYEQKLTFPLMRGETPGGYNIQYDARMARKPFIEAHAMKKFGGKVFWIDADTVTYKKVPESFLDACLPDDKFCCHLGRDWYYTESGFIGFNADHPMAQRFMESYLEIFKSGHVFLLERWHDCFAFDKLRQVVQAQGEDIFVNLAEKVDHGEMHPFVKTLPGEYMDHMKGPRKKRGFSEEHPVEWWKTSQG